ncbi:MULTISPECIES: SDR family oxidoreductase [unclassified Rathayibacter]|uniref:SDR family oxidoreductase n=1 Tax=unclassified Rathayibacter TaxID=2609250 RepID=UPI000F4C143D|nr:MULTISPECIES: SDR family NAD(P)-dependent oxidoreductase [unclassified Rathayibacter]MCJ1683426.1 SDR family NAD(P)-dependent oxidoreductase [Rathayibacter sp. VKM Ac-2928]ROP49706.1 NADP-dependent 3-hydroxy acid dehydrogenase YdfG [Rathayibacter sp. PhB186]ROS51800.1 NADP-dependent 3-hydroxy acid dehydrogenase YdfG [Rathayibacter sp. PhB185]
MDTEVARRVAWITGAGSGIGAASAERLAASGWTVALSGRSRERLDAVAERIGSAGGDALVVPLDVSDGEAVPAARDAVLAATGRIDALVLSAGLNSPRRTWGDQRLSELEEIVRTNLLGPVGVIDAALPELRAHAGAVVLVSSYSAWAFAPIAGVGYSASKKALAEIARTLNAQEAASGIRACHLCPGDVATDFLRHRPQVPDDEARARMLAPDDVARAVEFVLDSPAHVRIDELVISPVSQR